MDTAADDDEDDDDDDDDDDYDVYIESYRDKCWCASWHTYTDQKVVAIVKMIYVVEDMSIDVGLPENCSSLVFMFLLLPGLVKHFNIYGCRTPWVRSGTDGRTDGRTDRQTPWQTHTHTHTLAPARLYVIVR